MPNAVDVFHFSAKTEKDCADCVRNSAGEQPPKAICGQMLNKWHNGNDDAPAKSEIKHHGNGNPFVHIDGVEHNAQNRQSPNKGKKGVAPHRRRGERDQAKRSVRAGNKKKD